MTSGIGNYLDVFECFRVFSSHTKDMDLLLHYFLLHGQSLDEMIEIVALISK